MIISGRKIAKKMQAEVLSEVKKMKQSPRLAIVSTVRTGVTSSYLSIKEKVAANSGVEVVVISMEGATEKEVKEKLIELQESKTCDAVVLQLPVADGLEQEILLDAIRPEFDADVLSEGSRSQKKTTILSPVLFGVLRVLEEVKFIFENKNIIVIGDGYLVGLPIIRYFESKHIPHHVIVKETKEKVKKELIKSADLIISGAGAPGMIKPDMIKPGVTLIDVGTSEQSGKLVGDIDPLCESVCSYMTPTPGGLGPVAVSALMVNCLTLAKKHA